MVSHWSSRRRWACLLVACLALTGCASEGVGGEPARSVDGPLSVAAGGGGTMLLHPVPGRPNRRAVFGGLELCTVGAPVTIEKVRYRTGGGQGAWRPVLRSVPGVADRARPGSPNWAPLSAWRGDIFGPHASRRVPGDLSARVSGAHVAEPCTPGPDPTGARLELLTSVVAARGRGASVRDLAVDYRADGEAFTVTVPWAMTLCGDRGTHPDC